MIRSSLRALCCAASVLPFLVPTAAASDVLVVEPGTGSLQSAIDAAAPDSVLVLREGVYAGPTITRPVRLLADRNAFVEILTQTNIHSLDVGETVVFRGLRLLSDGTGGKHGLTVDGPGTVWIEDCDVEGLQGLVLFDEGSAIIATGGATLYLSRTDVLGGSGQFSSGLHAIRATGSSVFVHGGHLAAGPDFTAGFSAVELADSFGYFANATLTGSDGVPATILSCAGDGGPALRLTGALSSAVVNGSLLVGGEAGLETCVPPVGMNGPPFEAPAGAVTTLGSSARQFWAQSADGAAAGAIVGGEDADLFFLGEEADIVVLRIMAAAAPLYVAPFEGTLVSSVGTGKLMGVLPPNNPLGYSVLVKTVNTATPAPTDPHVAVFLQSVTITATEVLLGSGSHLVVVPDGVLSPLPIDPN